jgi:glycosyltransferase involved in cell wall biosynthesis
MTRRGRKILWIATAVYTAGLVAVSLLPSGEGPLGNWDAALTPDVQDALHLPAYSGLVILLSSALGTHIRLTAARTAWIALTCVGLGALLECLQAFIPGRTCSLKDGLVNAAGAALGYSATWIWCRFRGGWSAPASHDTPADQAMNTKPRVCMLVTNRGVDDPRVCMEAETLQRDGYAVTVIGWDRDADRDIEEKQNGVNFLRLKLRSTHGRGIAQPFFLSGFWLRAYGTLRRLRPEVIHCHDLDTLPVGWLAAKPLGARLVFDAHENFPDMMIEHLPKVLVSILRVLERWLVPRCDLLITVGNRLAEYYSHLGAKRVVVVGNWKDEADFQFSAEEIRHTRGTLGLHNGVIAICFIANLGHERRLDPLLATVAKDRRFACVVGGDGPQAGLARKYAANHTNIVYLGRVAPNHVPLLTVSCDVVYYGFDETNPNARWSAPNKLYEAIAASKPVLTGDFGEIGQTVRESSCGVLVNLREPEGVALALDHLAQPGVVYALGRNAGLASQIYSRSKANAKLLDAYRTFDRSTIGLAALPGRNSTGKR